MGEKIIIGPMNKGLRTDREPFYIDNDSFPTLINAYQWRGRVKRKRGTEFLGRLTREFNSAFSAINQSAGVLGNTSITLDVTGFGNILTGFTTLQTNAIIVPGTISLRDTTTATTYIDDGNGNLVGGVGSSVINYTTGAIRLPTRGGDVINATSFLYYPDLPVLGLEDLVLGGNQNPGTLGFDNTYSYNITTSDPATIYDVSFYKNLATATYSSYVQKANWTPITWNGPDYRQFWTINYQGALWATNTVNVPFNPSNIGMQYAPSSTISAVSTSATTLSATISNCPLVIGDFVFLNEWTGANAATLNWQTGYVTACAPNTSPLAIKTVTITFPNAAIGAGPFTPGIIQYLTTRVDTTIDCIRWYDGDPTNQVTNPPTFTLGLGWVNFTPPLSQSNFSIGDLPPAIYYLVGAKIVTVFKDRLLFFGPVVQQAGGNSIYLQDTVVYSQNGTAFYTCSFQGSVTSPTSNLALLVPQNQTATPNTYFSDSTGFGGFITAGIDQAINTLSNNEDVLLPGFDTKQSRFVYTGNDLVPFNFYITNSEYGSKSQFSSITMDKGAISRGSRGYILNSQTGSQRIDLPIPDEVFRINLKNNGTERFCSQRDFINEWIYFTYPSADLSYVYPNQTLFYNYRDESWSIFNESYTTYGTFRESTGLTWANVGNTYATWGSWDDPWNAGSNETLTPQVIAGNQQGFIVYRGKGTGESPSLYIQNIIGSPVSTVTSPNHGLSNGDWVVFNGVLGRVNIITSGRIFQITNATTNTFQTLPIINAGGDTYIGGGTITKIYIPLIQTKQFPVAWELARKTRLGSQQYLLTTTDSAQITLLIFLSQNSASPYNFPDYSNSSLVYSSILYTCPESTNLGLTAANTNLQMITEPATGVSPQSQIWHRVNNSLIGDTVQIGFTLSNAQVDSYTPTNETYSPITNVTNAYPTVVTVSNNLSVGTIITISGVNGMVEINNATNPATVPVWEVTAASSSSITINADSTGYSIYSGPNTGVITVMEFANQFEEIELHSMILDVSPSQLLA